jgi:hypothetical protein
VNIPFFSNTGNIDNIEFSFNGKSIPLSTSHKHLGVILSQNDREDFSAILQQVIPDCPERLITFLTSFCNIAEFLWMGGQ